MHGARNLTPGPSPTRRGVTEAVLVPLAASFSREKDAARGTSTASVTPLLVGEGPGVRFLAPCIRHQYPHSTLLRKRVVARSEERRVGEEGRLRWGRAAGIEA